MSIVVILITLCEFVFVYANSLDYEVPVPQIKVLEPKGFRVSIPHEKGIQLFAFHGNVNRPIGDMEAGEISKDVMKPKNGKWIIEDHETKLRNGDTIHYWLFVIKKHFGYRLNEGRFVVDVGQNDITSTSPEGSQEANFHASSAHFSTRFRPNKDFGYEIALKVSDIAGDLYEEVKKLREINGVLKELVRGDEHMSRILRFEGAIPPFDDPDYVAQMIISEKLLVDVPVFNATRNGDESISFQVASLDDKVFLIRTAKNKFVNSRIKLVY